MAQPHVKIFVGSSTESNDLSFALAYSVSDIAKRINRHARIDAVHWSTIFDPGPTTIERLEQAVKEFHFAVFVAAKDDVLIARNQTYDITRSNVILEFGMFVGALTRDRTFLIIPDDLSVNLPNDLDGVALLKWQVAERNQPRAAVSSAAYRLATIALDTPLPHREEPLQLLTRGALANVLPPLSERLATAKRELRISGNDCKAVVESQSPYLEAALKKPEMNVKVLCVNPANRPLTAMLAMVDDRFHTAAQFEQSMMAVADRLEDFRSRYPQSFEYRYLNFLPALGFFIADPEDGGIVKVETYTAKPHAPVGSRPHMVLPESSEWRPYFVNCWDNYWNSAISP